jgi:hypothetical protein
MKPLIAILVSLPLLVACPDGGKKPKANQSLPQQDEAAKLFASNGRYTMHEGKNGALVSTLLLDSQTGHVWIMAHTKENQQVFQDVPVFETPAMVDAAVKPDMRLSWEVYNDAMLSNLSAALDMTKEQVEAKLKAGGWRKSSGSP